MNYLIGAIQIAFIIGIGTLTFMGSDDVGPLNWLGHVFFAFVYCYWVTLWIFKAVPYAQKAIRALRLDFWR